MTVIEPRPLGWHTCTLTNELQEVSLNALVFGLGFDVQNLNFKRGIRFLLWGGASLHYFLGSVLWVSWLVMIIQKSMQPPLTALLSFFC